MNDYNTHTYILSFRWGKRNGSKTSPEKMPNGELDRQSVCVIYMHIHTHHIHMHLTGDSIVFETHGGRTSAIVISSSSSSTAVVSKKVTKKAVSKTQAKGESSTIQHTPTAAAKAHASVSPASAMVGSSLTHDLDSPGQAEPEVKGKGKRGRKREPVTQDVVEEKISDSSTATAVDEVLSVDSKRVRRGRR